MEDLLDVIISRRSVKKYKDEMIDKELIDKVIKAGMYAPSGKNRQSSVIISVSKKDVRDKLSSLLAEFRGVEIDPFYGAPVVIAVLADKAVNTHLYDGSCVIENMLLEAHSLGLGACWIHHAKEVFETEFGKFLLETLGITDDLEGVGFCILGIPDMEVRGELPRKDNYVYYIN